MGRWRALLTGLANPGRERVGEHRPAVRAERSAAPHVARRDPGLASAALPEKYDRMAGDENIRHRVETNPRGRTWPLLN